MPGKKFVDVSGVPDIGEMARQKAMINAGQPPPEMIFVQMLQNIGACLMLNYNETRMCNALEILRMAQSDNEHPISEDMESKAIEVFNNWINNSPVFN